MQECHLCETIAGKRKGWKVYEDKKIVALLSEIPASAGHVIIMPKEHYPILESVPDYVVAHAFNVANKISVALFEALGAQGTNIIVNNGTAAGQEFAHLMIHVIARRQNDGMNFQWQPRQLTEEQMSTVELTIKEQTKNIGAFEKEKPKPIELEKKPVTITASAAGKREGAEKTESGEGAGGAGASETAESASAGEKEKSASEEENYLLRQLRKIP